MLLHRTVLGIMGVIVLSLVLWIASRIIAVSFARGWRREMKRKD